MRARACPGKILERKEVRTGRRSDLIGEVKPAPFVIAERWVCTLHARAVCGRGSCSCNASIIFTHPLTFLRFFVRLIPPHKLAISLMPRLTNHHIHPHHSHKSPHERARCLHCCLPPTESSFLEELMDPNAGHGGGVAMYQVKATPPWLDDNRDLRAVRV